MRRFLLIVAGVLAGCVADPDRAPGPDVGDAGGSDSGMSACQVAARQAKDARNLEIALMLCWIEENTEYRNLRPPLYWVDMTAAEIVAHGARGRPSSSGALALYNCGLKTMYMNKEWDLREFLPRQALLHELVHHAQCTSGKMTGTLSPMPAETCAIEREAYTLQAKYIRQEGDRSLTPEQRTHYWAGADNILKSADRVCSEMGVR